jgi:CHASE2 domain-containing sensor protein
MAVFEVVSKLGKRIRLTEIQWAHMRSRHPELLDQLENMKATLVDPDFVFHSPKEENHQYHKNFKETPVTEKFLLLIVKHLNEEGFVITGFFVSRIRRKGKVLVYEKEDIHKL